MPLPAVDVALTLFGGKDTSLSPAVLPEGLSPANNDVQFGPGFVASRDGLAKIFAAPFPGNPAPSTLWAEDFLQANGQHLNLYLDSNGVLHQEDISNSPGVHTQVAQLSPAVKTFKATNFDGAEYMAFSDGVHGVDVPRFYDGQFFDRISKDGVGSLTGIMTCADIVTTVALTSVTLAPSVAITATHMELQSTGLINITFTTAAPHGIQQGQLFLSQGVAAVQYNAVYGANIVPDATHIIVTGAAGVVIADSAGGTLGPATATVVTGAAHGMNPGDAFTYSGNAGTMGQDKSGNPIQWVVLSVTNSTTLVYGLLNNFGTLAGGQANTTGGAGGTLTPGGMGTVGVHQLCVSFLWRGGYITRPCPPITFTSVGNKQWQTSNLPIGPTGVIGRILSFTGSGGGSFFYISSTSSQPGPTQQFGPSTPNILVNSTVILDNTTTSFIVDAPDNTIFSGVGIDITGNNLFDLVPLTPCIGFDSYAGRISAWGMVNNVLNFDNMGFEGGIVTANQPLSWGTFGAGGALVAAPNGFGDAWQITGDGSGNNRGTLTQPAFQNHLFLPIIQPSTKYSFWTLANCSAVGLTGNVKCTLSSMSTGFTATATIPINTISSGAPAFVSVNFDLQMPAVIPSDFTLTVFENGLNNGATVTLDELMVVFRLQPYITRTFRWSYIDNPESFDGKTGSLGSTEDPNPIIDTFQILEQFFFLTTKRLHVTRDAAVEPGDPNGGWDVTQREDNVGGCSIHCASTSNAWATWLSDTGKSIAQRIFSGGESSKISREMKTDFEAVNMAAKQTCWLVNVDSESRMYMGIPQGVSTLPSTLAVLDYFESDTADQIAQNRPLKIGFTGKMLTTDLGRKWTTFSLPMACGALLARPGGLTSFVVGSGPTPAGISFGNAYTFSANNLTDDDYGIIGGASGPMYTTYFFINHDMEQQLQVGSLNKFYDAMTTFIPGTGSLKLAMIANRLGNKVKDVINPDLPYVLNVNQQDDQEWTGIDTRARRLAVQISAQPLPGTTDVKWTLTHMGMKLRKDPVAPMAGVTR